LAYLPLGENQGAMTTIVSKIKEIIAAEAEQKTIS
jgi:hypothetical protein